MNPTHHLAASVVYDADRTTRADLAQGVVTSERDYGSTFAARVRDRWTCLGRSALVHSWVLPPGQEQALGCDIAMVLRWEHFAKVCLIETKWPRFNTSRRPWDGVQGHVSHFSHQIMRQARWAGSAAVWEMFFHEEHPGTTHPLFDAHGSTCVAHELAAWFDSVYRDRHVPWTNADVYNLMLVASGGPWFAGRASRNVFGMLNRVTACRLGERVPIVQGAAILESVIGRQVVRVPATLAALDDGDLLGSFQAETGVSTLLLLEMEAAEG